MIPDSQDTRDTPVTLGTLVTLDIPATLVKTESSVDLRLNMILVRLPQMLIPGQEKLDLITPPKEALRNFL